MSRISRRSWVVRVASLAALTLLSVPNSWGAATVTGLNLVSSTRTGRTTYNYTYTITVSNGTPALPGAVAKVTSTAAATVIVQGSVALGDLAVNSTVTSTATFTLSQDRTVPFNASALSWVIAGQSGGATLLPGARSSNAVAAITTLPLSPVDPTAIQNRIVLNEINIVIDLAATVGQVNDAISAASGSIVAMESGIPELTIRVPAAPSVDALGATAATLQSMPGILLATPATLAGPKSWPTTATTAPSANLQQLAASRTLAAFKVGSQLKTPCSCTGDSCPTVIVQDEFADTVQLGQPADFSGRFPNFVTPPEHCIVDPQTNMCENHGNHVLLVFGAAYTPGSDAANVMLGAEPFQGCINVVPLQSSTYNSFQERSQLSITLKGYIDTHPGASAIVSSSQGWLDSCRDQNNNIVACSTLTPTTGGNPAGLRPRPGSAELAAPYESDLD